MDDTLAIAIYAARSKGNPGFRPWDKLPDYAKDHWRSVAETARTVVDGDNYAIPEGWTLVPKEITTDMMGAFHHGKRVFKTVPEIWNHILNTAPHAPMAKAADTPDSGTDGAHTEKADALPKTYYIAWNEDKTEGFVSDTYRDALHAAGKVLNRNFYSTAAEMFREVYEDADCTVDTATISTMQVETHG